MERATLSSWVNRMPARGCYFFTKKDILDQFPDMGLEAIRSAIRRMNVVGRIFSPWKDFYVVVPEENAPQGRVAQEFFIDALMKHLGRRYYVCLLNAAARHGAAHQAVMTFMVMTEPPTMRSKVKGDMALEFTFRSRMPMEYVQQRKVRTGYFNVSSPELTALDLVAYYQKVGGLNRVVVVLSELVEAMDAQRIDERLLSYFSVADIQRLGYLLDVVLGEQTMADRLYELGHSDFRKAALRYGRPTEGAEYCERWKMMINERVEVEE